MKSWFCAAICAATALAGLPSMASEAADSAPSVLQVTARQRYPWNGKVDIDCKVSGGSAEKSYALTVTAHDKVGGTNLTVSAVALDGDSSTGTNPVMIGAGESGTRDYRLVWDAGKDLPQGFKSGKISVSVGITEPAKKYLVIELGSGAVTYMSEPPEGGFDTDEYKTTKMAFVRIEPQSYMQMETETYGRKVTITKPFYISMYQVTKTQYLKFGNEGDINDRFRYSEAPFAIEGTVVTLMGLDMRWPKSDIPNGFLRKMRDSTGLMVNLPTVGMLCLAQMVLRNVGCCVCVEAFGDYNSQPLSDPVEPNCVADLGYSMKGRRACVEYNDGLFQIRPAADTDTYGRTASIYLCIHDARNM